MSAEIINAVREDYPALRFIGKRYTNADCDPVTGMFSNKWEQWHSEGLFGALAGHANPAPEHGDSCLAFMGADGEEFEYWIGIFFPEGTPVPDGFDVADIPALSAGVCYIKGTEPDIYLQHDRCVAELLAEEITASTDLAKPRRWFAFERYSCPRYTEPDGQGNVILDYGIVV
ncbi:MAG: hypothetical protein LBQ91_06970 [Oscillospiraceae bacterium]|jgi:predicted transcriptional regulator YdeE|nr:hypothetical protein [Oscillospiraceae bacterium]